MRHYTIAYYIGTTGRDGGQALIAFDGKSTKEAALDAARRLATEGLEKKNIVEVMVFQGAGMGKLIEWFQFGRYHSFVNSPFVTKRKKMKLQNLQYN